MRFFRVYTYIYGLNEWSKSDLPLAFETTKIQSPASGHLSIVIVVLNSRVPWKGIRYGPTAASGSTARG